VNTQSNFLPGLSPAARDPDWLPTYNILQLQVEGTGKNRRLVGAFTRENSDLSIMCLCLVMAENGQNWREYKAICLNGIHDGDSGGLFPPFLVYLPPQRI